MSEQDLTTYAMIGQWGISLTVLYIALANIAASVLIWKIMNKYGWALVARLLTIGFIVNSIAWWTFNLANELFWPIAVPQWVKALDVFLGVVFKAISITIIVIGLFIWWARSRHLFVRKTVLGQTVTTTIVQSTSKPE